METASSQASLSTLLRVVIVVAVPLTDSTTCPAPIHLTVAFLRRLTRVYNLPASLQALITRVASCSGCSHIVQLRLVLVVLFDDCSLPSTFKIAGTHICWVIQFAVFDDSGLATHLDLIIFTLISDTHGNICSRWTSMLRPSRNRRLGPIIVQLSTRLLKLILVVLIVILVFNSTGASQTPQTFALPLLA